MSWTFNENQEDQFFAARDGLIERFQAWRGTPAEALPNAEMMLNWKWGYDDGDLVTWTIDHLDEFLLSWVPRKVTINAADAGWLVESARGFMAFLAEAQLLGRGSSRLAALDLMLAKSEKPLVEALGDPAKFGMGKSLFAGMAERGLDVGPDGMPDAESINAMMEAFNSLSFEERGEILGSHNLMSPPSPSQSWSPWAELTDGIELRPALTAPAAQVEAAVMDIPLMRRIEAVRRFVGAGRKLTATGNLNLADGRALANELDIDQMILGDDRPAWRGTVRSSAELGELQLTLRWARLAGATKLANKRLLATASWAKLSPVAAYTKAVTAMIEKGPLSVRYADNQWSDHAVHRVIDDGVPHLLAVLWAVDDFEFDDLAEAAFEVCDQMLQWAPHIPLSSIQRRVRHSVEALFELLGMAGLAVIDEQEVVTDQYGSEEWTGGVVALTPLARTILGPYLAAHGYEIPVVGTLTAQPMAVLFDRIGAWAVERVRAEFTAWVDAHSVEQAITEVRRLVGQGSEPAWRIAAVDLLSGIAPEPNESAVRALLDTAARGQAINWLLTEGADDVPDDVDAMLRAGVELLAAQMTPGFDDEADAEWIEMVSNIQPMSAFVSDIWRIPEPHVGDVLAAIGRLHPNPADAKAARKALMQHRSHMANLR